MTRFEPDAMSQNHHSAENKHKGRDSHWPLCTACDGAKNTTSRKAIHTRGNSCQGEEKAILRENHPIIKMMGQVPGAFEVVRHWEMAPDFTTFKLWVRVEFAFVRSDLPSPTIWLNPHMHLTFDVSSYIYQSTDLRSWTVLGPRLPLFYILCAFNLMTAKQLALTGYLKRLDKRPSRKIATIHD